MVSGIDGLAGVLVFTSPERFPAMESFYVDVLELSPRSRRPGFVNFSWGDQRLTIAVHSEVADRTTEPDRIMVNLRCRDLDGEYRRLVTLGVEVVRPPDSESWGGRICTLVDPDGNRVQLIQLAEDIQELEYTGGSSG